MKINADISSINPKQLLIAAQHYTGLAVSVAILGLVGFTGYQASRVFSVPVNEAYLHEHEADSKTANLKLKPDTLNQLRQLHDPGSKPPSVPVGKRSPFSYQDTP